MVSLLLGEITNPFNILRKFYDYNGQKKESTTVGVLFIFAFLLCRVVICPFLIHWVNVDPRMSFTLKLSSVVLQWVSLVWAWKIINMGLKTLTEVKQPNAGVPQQFLY